MHNEKAKMEQKVAEFLNELKDWNKYTPQDLTNNIKYTASKMMSNELTGKIMSASLYPIIAFQRIDRGVYINSRILAQSTAFKIYYEYTNNEIIIFYDDAYLGKIVNQSAILNTAHLQIGSCSRTNSPQQISYEVVINSKIIGRIMKGTDRNAFETNIFFKRIGAAMEHERHMKNYRPPGPAYQLLHDNHSTTAEEEKWLIALSIFEAVYHGYDFNA